MSYNVVLLKDNHFGLIENDSGTTIHLGNRKEKQVRDICRKCNLGSGFNGFTPSFFSVSTGSGKVYNTLEVK
jgi:hypothetical protein